MAALLVLASAPAPGPYLAGIIVGFLIGGFGHLIKSNLAIIAGIATIAIVTAIFTANIGA